MNIQIVQVSKAWNILALDGSNWQNVDLFEFQVDIEGVVVENLAKRCGGFLKSLSLNGCQVSFSCSYPKMFNVLSSDEPFAICL